MWGRRVGATHHVARVVGGGLVGCTHPTIALRHGLHQGPIAERFH
jgi:hypothetical protein